MFKDYYQILGVKQASELKDIKKSYRELALKYHPDINKLRQAKEKFIEATEAYVVLKNVDKRRLYNKLYNQYYNKLKNIM
jgi:curved DNA-binding protein